MVLWQAGEAWWDRSLFRPEKPGLVRWNLDTAAAEALLAREPRLSILDVCSEGEYRWMHLPGARNLPTGSADLAARLEGLDREVPYLVYCAAGFRSRQIFSRMKAMGFRELYNLDRGLYGWRAAGRDVESGSGEGG